MSFVIKWCSMGLIVRIKMGPGGVAAVGGVAEDVDVESMPARSQARDLAPHLGVPGGGALEEVEGAGDRAVGAASDEGDPLESAGFPCHASASVVPALVRLRRLTAPLCLSFPTIV